MVDKKLDAVLYGVICSIILILLFVGMYNMYNIGNWKTKFSLVNNGSEYYKDTDLFSGGYKESELRLYNDSKTVKIDKVYGNYENYMYEDYNLKLDGKDSNYLILRNKSLDGEIVSEKINIRGITTYGYIYGDKKKMDKLIGKAVTIYKYKGKKLLIFNNKEDYTNLKGIFKEGGKKHYD